MELTIEFTDNLDWEMRNAVLYNGKRVMFNVTFSKGSNSRSIGSYKVWYDGLIYFTMGGSLGLTSYSKQLIKGLKGMGFTLDKDQVAQALVDKREHNLMIARKEIQMGIDASNSAIKRHNKEITKELLLIKRMTQKLNRLK